LPSTREWIIIVMDLYVSKKTINALYKCNEFVKVEGSNGFSQL